MIKFFRHIRKDLMEKNKTGKYLKYAAGKIILVVVGILLAIQVNNWNIERTDKDREAKYKTNIVLDLEKDLIRLDFLIEFRKIRVLGDQQLVKQMNGAPVGDLTELSKNVINTLMEEPFLPNNSTFSELSSSGNLNLISNDSIKLLLLELEELYKLNHQYRIHEVFDYQEYISKPVNHSVHIDQLFPIFMGTKTIKEQQITFASFSALLENKTYKNGLFIMSIMSSEYIKLFEKIREKSKKIINIIELRK
jgi:hypothetical protein